MRPRCSTGYRANRFELRSSQRPAPVGGAVSVAAHDAVVDTKEEPDGHHETEIETRKIRSQSFFFSETINEEAGIYPIKVCAGR
jgi:hypothetical protein